MKAFFSITTLIIGILLILPSCSPSFSGAKPSDLKKKAIPDMQYYADKNGNGSFDKIELEEKPQPRQGKDQWTRDFYGAIKYPPSARSKSIQGIVTLSVTINKLGMVQEVTILNSLSSDCDAAAKTAFLQSTKQGYTPLILDGNAVDFKVDIPVGFWLG